MRIDPVSLKKHREAKGWTQAELSFAVDMSRPFLSQLESGVRGISPENLLVIADALAVDIDELRYSEDEPKICEACGLGLADS